MARSGTFAAKRWVRLMCDYTADGVWHKDGAAGDASQLPVDKAIIERIRRWQAMYETLLEDEASFDVEAFAAEGLSIAKAIKSALPDWTVIYFDEAALYRAEPNARRDEYEYEIK